MDTLYGQSLEQLRSTVGRLELPRFAAAQLSAWLYKKHVVDIDAMTDISLSGRERLKAECSVGLSAAEHVSESVDGTKKYLFRTASGRFVESAFIPDGQRATLCISSQAGCRMGCAFCATGRGGWHGNLTAAEILNQIESLPERDRLTNVVLMGMGEPLDNADEVLRALEVMTSSWGYAWSPTRVTLSTVGVVPELKRFIESTDVNLAISLHNPVSAERAAIMPVERAYPIAEVVDLIKKYDFTHQRRVSFEYIVLKGMNDTPDHVKAIARLLDGLKCRINLIRFHAIPDSPFVSPDALTMTRFRDALSRKGIITTIRASRGEDIEAACGLLSAEHRNESL